MSDEQIVATTRRALEIAEAAWRQAFDGLPSNPMTRTAAIPAIGILAATLLDQLDDDDAAVRQRVEQAIHASRQAWELTHVESPGNPMAATASRSVIGILAAGILNHAGKRRRSDGAAAHASGPRHVRSSD